MANTIKIKRGTNLSNAGTPEAGELIFDSGNTKLYVGDGSTAATGLTAIGASATSLILSGHTMNDVDIGSEFVDTDDHLMSSGAIKEKIEDYGYLTSVPNHSGNLITSGTVASAYLDADTAHLSGTQTFSGAKTFSSSVDLASELNFTGNTNKYIDVSTLDNDQSLTIRHHNPIGNVFEDALKLTANAGARLYYDNGARFTTTSAGADLVGTLAATTSITIGSNSNFLTTQLKVGDGTRDIRLNANHGSKAAVGTVGAHDFNFFTANTIRATVDSGGNFGIGTESPLRKLHVVGSMAVNEGSGQYYGILMGGGESNDPKITIGDWHNSSGSIMWDSSDNVLRIDSQHSTANRDIVFSGNDFATEYMRVNATGLGIGTNSPATVLHVSKSQMNPGSTSALPIVRIAGSYGGGLGFLDTKESGIYQVDNGDTWNFYCGRTIGSDTALSKVALTMKSDGKIGIGTTSPTYALDVVGDIGVNHVIYHNDDTDTYIQLTDNRIRLYAGGTLKVDTNETYATGDAIINSGTWNGAGFGGSRYKGLTINSGELSIQRDHPNGGQVSLLVDGGYSAGENNGFWSLYSGNNWGNRVGFYSNSSGVGIFNTTHSSGDWNFQVNGSSKMYIDGSASRVGINTTGPSYDLHVAGHAYASSSFLGPDGSAGTPSYRFHNDGNSGMFKYAGDQLGFSTAGTTRMVINNNGPDFINTSGLYMDNRRFFEMRSNSNDRGSWNPLVSSIRHSGVQRYFDEEFVVGSNGVSLYNNAGGSNLVVSRITASADSLVPPNSSGKVIKVAYNGNGTTSPNFGGIYQTITSEENHTFAQVFQAKLPSGRKFVINENAQGTRYTSYWMTSDEGTGKWEWYVRVSHCGDSGTFSSGGHISVSGGADSAFNWYIASMTQYDVTEAPAAGMTTGDKFVLGSTAGNLRIEASTQYQSISVKNSSNAYGILNCGTLYAGTRVQAGGGMQTWSSAHGFIDTVLNDGTYTKILNPEGSVSLYLGDSGDGNNYYQAGEHRFRSYDGNTYFARIGDGHISGRDTNFSIRRNNNNDDRVTIEASETTIYGDASMRCSIGSYGYRSDIVGDASTPCYSWRADTNTGMYRPGADTIGFSVAGSESFRVTTGGAITYGTHSMSGALSVNYGATINETGNNSDFRVESVGDPHMFRVDADANKIGIRISNPQKTLHVFQGEGGVGAKHATIRLGGYSTVGPDIAAYRHTGNSNDQGLIFSTYHNSNGTTDTLTMDSEGRVGIGTTAPGSLLTVRKDGTQVSSPSTSYQIMTVSNSNGGIAIQAGASSDAFISFGDPGQYDAGRIRYHNSTHYMDFCTGGNNPRMTIKNDGKIVVNGTDSDSMFRVNSTQTENVVKIYGNAARGASRYALMIDDNDTNGRGSVYVENASGTGMKIVTQGSNYLMDLVSNNDGSNPARSCGVRMTSYEGRANGHYHHDANYGGEWFSGNRYAGNMTNWHVGYRSGTSGDTPDYLSRARIMVDTSGNFHADADVVAYSSTIGSDIKLKKNVEDIGYGLDDVLKMRAVEFDWKEKRQGKHDIGVIAQELEKIIPEVVNEVKTIGEGAENGDTHKVVDYAKLTSVLIKAIQQQQVQIDELKIQIGE